VNEGARRPRICVIPDGDEHPRWTEAVDLLGKIGIELDGWQLDILHASLLRRGDLWAAFTVGLCAPRQNGKTLLLLARELVGALLLGERLLIHSAHLSDTSLEAFQELDGLIDSSDWLLNQIDYVRRTNGRELVKFHNGARIRFRTRTRGGGRGFSGSPVIFDEPLFFPVISQNAILPVMSAQPDPQAWYTGSAVDQIEHQDGIVFARVRERALAGDDDRLAYFEWSLDAETPNDVGPDLANDLCSWAATNPALGIRITPEYIEAERKELTPRGFAVERLGVGDWPDTSGVTESMVDLEAWAEAGDEDLEPIGDRVLIFDVSPERRSAIVSVSVCGADELLVAVLEDADGTAWVPAKLFDLHAEGDVVEIVCDGKGPAGALAQLVEDEGLTVRRFDSEEHADACGLFVDLVREGKVRHRNQVSLNAAILGSRTRPLVDRWAWSRRNSSINIAPLVAATLGVKAAMDCDILHYELHIY